jgi:hypothetical protein
MHTELSITYITQHTWKKSTMKEAFKASSTCLPFKQRGCVEGGAGDGGAAGEKHRGCVLEETHAARDGARARSAREQQGMEELVLVQRGSNRG